jgi:endonuclease/exonuclease/phosphatase family metal-dependent hydrolase
MHKAVGLDGRRDPHRVLRVLQEIDADVVALQEADRRVGGRASTVPHALIDSHGMYKPVHFGVRHKRTLEGVRKPADRLLKVDTRNIGWHGNAILVKHHVGVLD